MESQVGHIQILGCTNMLTKIFKISWKTRFDARDGDTRNFLHFFTLVLLLHRSVAIATQAAENFFFIALFKAEECKIVRDASLI